MQSGNEPTDFVSIACPYCGESYGTPLDLSGGSSTYIEDCQVCCQPIELCVTVNAEGELMEVEPQRLD
ncbi:MAG: CPXCG motif-containing cysteine-rich protein [Steroidobacteraceae bacterium]